MQLKYNLIICIILFAFSAPIYAQKNFNLKIEPQKLKELYSNYKNVYENKLEIYRKNRKWYKAELVYNKKKYAVKIKLKGKSPPSNLKDNYSLVVKLVKDKINGHKKFDLMNFERVQYLKSKSFYEYLPDYFKIIRQQHELVHLTINEKKRKYYLETRVKRKFLKYQGYSDLRIFNLSILKSPFLSSVKASTKDKTKESSFHLKYINEEIEKFKFKLKKWKKPSPKHIIERINSINADILNQNEAVIHKYFNLDYIARFEALRLLGGFGKHGQMHHNAIWAYDTSSGYLYPVFHRDIFPHLLEKRKYLEKDLSQNESEIIFYNLLAQNDIIRKKKLYYLKQALKDIEVIKKIKKDTSVFSKMVQKNFKHLQEEFKKYEIEASQLGNTIQVKLKSFFPLQLSLCQSSRKCSLIKEEFLFSKINKNLGQDYRTIHIPCEKKCSQNSYIKVQTLFNKREKRVKITKGIQLYPLKLSHTSPQKFEFSHGVHTIKKDLIINENSTLSISPGATLRFIEGSSLIILSNIKINGLKNKKITFKFTGKKRGGLFVLGGGQYDVQFKHIIVHGANSKEYAGGFFSGGVSLYHIKNLMIEDLLIADSIAYDALNIKSTNFNLKNITLKNGPEDLIDIDHSSGKLKNIKLTNSGLKSSNGDCLDFNFSSATVSNGTFNGCRDKGISIGLKSDIKINNSNLNKEWIVIKESSQTYLDKNQIKNIKILPPTPGFEKKSIIHTKKNSP